MFRWIVAGVSVVLVGCSQSGPGSSDSGVDSGAGAGAGAGAETSHVSPAAEHSDATGATDGADAMDDDVLSYTMNRIDGTPEPLSDYRGKVVMIVNVASKCGYTPQYEQLESMYERYRDRGFVVLGFPANQFKQQEPGTNQEIAEFCTANYGVTFPMFEKIVVKGEGTAPLYRRLAELSAEPSWNFTKYLVDRHGRFVERFEPKVVPDDPAVVARVEELLNG